MEQSQGLTELLKALQLREGARSALEDRLRRWAQPPGDTEKEKCERAVRMVKQAIDEDPKLSQMEIEVFPKGSFHNRINVPSDSDVDVGVLLKKWFLNEYPPGMSNADFGFVAATFHYEEFKADVAVAIKNKFGARNVTVGKKAITVHANTVRVDADVVPHFMHRRYNADKTYLEGVALKAESGAVIYNWPNHDYANGVAKNERTKKRYKAFVRILKTLRGEMLEAGYSSANAGASYLIACLAYNVPDDFFGHESYEEMVEECLLFLKGQLSDLRNVQHWGEVNGLKLLFGSHQGRKFEEVFAFISDALTFFGEIQE